MSFFKNVLASMVGTILAFGALIGLFILIIISAIAGASGGEKAEIKDTSILHITLDGAFTERENEHGGGFDPSSFGEDPGTGLKGFIEDLDDAKNDERIKGVFLEVKSVLAAPSTMRDIRKALTDFRSGGKWIVAFSEGYSQGGYYIASAADEVYLYPEGDFDWRGLNAEVMFFKKLLDKLEIEAQIIRGPDNKFKSAVEPFMYDHMSDANREQVRTFIGDIWNQILGEISASRNVPVEVLTAAADSLSYMDPNNALNAGLLTGLKYRDEVYDILRGKIGLSDTTATVDSGDDEEEEKSSKDDLPFVKLADYEPKKDEDRKHHKEKIAVVYAVGGIESGEGDDATIGSDRIAAALKKAREDKNVKAIVLRVNSPGGSALASDVIWRETQLIRDSGKPLVVSMGDYAASGGYYISCAANRIFANPNTITGSIGVFGVLPNMQKFFDNKLGITFDRYETNPHADMMSASKPLDPAELKAFQGMVTDIYDDFTSKVATGRNMTQAQVDSIGQGRVWSGEDALQLGLVDELGDLNAAIKSAAALAGVTEYDVRDLPEMIDPFDQLMKELQGQKASRIAEEIVKEEIPFIEDLRTIRNMRGVQARMPFILTIR